MSYTAGVPKGMMKLLLSILLGVVVFVSLTVLLESFSLATSVERVTEGLSSFLQQESPLNQNGTDQLLLSGKPTQQPSLKKGGATHQPPSIAKNNLIKEKPGSVISFTANDTFKYENGFGPMDDPGLVRFIQQHHLKYPSQWAVNMSGPEQHKSQVGQSQFVDKLLKGRRNGFFVEVGAENGVEFSNSYFFEKYRGWNGLLIEGNKGHVQNILTHRQGSYFINAALATTNKTKRIKFGRGSFGFNSISKDNSYGSELQSFPLYTLLKAIGASKVDYWSLDIEGQELEALKTIPWEKVRIDVITLEYRAIPGSRRFIEQTEERRQMFLKWFQQLGLYDHVGTIEALDLVFARKDLNFKKMQF